MDNKINYSIIYFIIHGYRQSLADYVWEPQRVAELCRYYYEAHNTILYDTIVTKSM